MCFRQIQAITVDPKSVELIRLFRSDKGLESMSPRILSVYRLRAEDIVGSEENLYKINFVITNYNDICMQSLNIFVIFFIG